MTGFRDDILNLIKNSGDKLTLTDLIKKLSREKNLSGLKVKKEIRSLVDEGVLEYLNELGHTFPVLSFNREVRLSKRVVVYPPGISILNKNKEDFYIKIEKSTSFGRGNHPTTRLSLKAIEEAFSKGRIGSGSVFDVGCGTGILAMASVFMGMEKAFGVDIDPVAIFDCKKNISLNSLENKMAVSDKWPEKEEYDLLCANLRPPTLVEYKESFREYLKDDGAVVFSGFKPEEEGWLFKDMSDLFDLQRVWRENDWCSVLMYPR